MQIKTIDTGYYGQNCYVLKKGKEALIIDPGNKENLIIETVGDAKVLAVLLTHRHFDHIGALSKMLDVYKVDTIDVKSETKQSLGAFNFEIIKTAGHSSDSVTYYFEKEAIMFTGDFLFAGDIGRTDLPTGSNDDMLKSLRKIFEYPEEIIIYPGHEEPSTLAKEKKLYY